jgi:hypothetical protein
MRWLALAVLVAGCSPVTEQLYRDQTWVVMTTGASACGMAAKPPGQHLLVIYVEGSSVQRLELEGPPATTLVSGTTTQVDVDAGPGFRLPLTFAPLPGTYPIIASVLDDARYERLMAGLTDHRLYALVVSFPNGEQWQLPAPPAVAVSTMADCRSRVR